jgi:hypothetical protein
MVQPHLPHDAATAFRRTRAEKLARKSNHRYEMVGGVMRVWRPIE